MTLADAIELFDQKNRDGRVVHLRKECFHSISENRRRVIVSHVKNAVAAACPDQELLNVDLDPLLETLADFARKHAEEHGRARPANEPSSVRVFLATVEGFRRTRTKRRKVRRSAFFPEWKPLFDALASSDAPRRYRSALYRLQDFLALRGIRTPEELPSRNTIMEWIRGDDTVRNSVWSHWFAAYRKAWVSLGDPEIPQMAERPDPRCRGLGSIVGIDQMLKRRGSKLPLEKLGPIGAAQWLAPQIARAFEHYVEWASGKKRPNWLANVARSCGTLVAELIRMDCELAELDLLDLYLKRRPIDLDMEANDVLKRRLSGNSAKTSVSLLRLVLESAAKRSAKSSPLELAHDGAVGQDEVPFFGRTIENDLKAIWAVTREVYGTNLSRGGGLEELDPEQWARVSLEQQAIKRYMADTNANRPIVGRIDKSLIRIPWAQAVCLGVHHLVKQVRKTRESYWIALQRHREVGETAFDTDNRVRTVREKRRAYFKALHRYMVFALPLDDGLRAAQYTWGLCNVHFQPKVDKEVSDTGEVTWCRITGLKTTWRGHDGPAALKESSDSAGVERSRSRQVLPGILGPDMLTEYWLLVRPYRLATCGLIPDPTRFNPEQDRAAFFVSPRSVRDDGAYSSTDPLSSLFGEILNEVIQLAGYNVPTTKQLSQDEELKKQYRGLFGLHITRHLIATYHGGILGEWSRAAYLTDDDERTLREYYYEFKDQMDEAYREEGIRHPHHFDEVVRVLRSGRRIDWAAFDPDRPEETIVLAGDGKRAVPIAEVLEKLPSRSSR